MLTASEKQWLKSRKQWRYYSCRWCHAFPVASKQIGPSPCVQKCRKDKKHPFCYGFRFNIFREAAEFEARVADKIATAWKDMIDNYEHTPCDACPNSYCHDNCLKDCHDNILKWARLAVEEEGLHWTART